MADSEDLELGTNAGAWEPPTDEFVCGEGPAPSQKKAAAPEQILIPADIWEIMKAAESRGYPHETKKRRFRNC